MKPPPTRITGLAGLYKGRYLVLNDSLLTIGRARSNDVSFARDSALSRDHLQIAYRNGEWTVQDLGSTNGTFVNDRRLSRWGTETLRPGDIVGCGLQAFRLDWTPDPPPDPAEPPLQAALFPASEIPAQEPVVLSAPSAPSKAAAPTAHEIPPPPARPAPKKVQPHRWVAPGERVEVQGRTIDAGLFFFGTKMRDSINYGTEPSLVDPALNTAVSEPENGRSLPTDEPHYGEFFSWERARFLDWMAAGRPPESMHDTDGLLFLSGIERRSMTVDADSPELSQALEELRRLAKDAPAGSRAAAKMREFVLVLDPLAPSPEELLAMATLATNAGRQSVAAHLLLARRATDGQALSPEEALLALLADEETHLRTPFFRCHRQVERMFRHRVERRYPRGVAVRTLKGTFEYHYIAANIGLYGLSIPLEDLQRFRVPPTTMKKLRVCLAEATDALDAYSRRLGIREHEADRLPAVGLLPEEVARDHPEIRRLAELVGAGGRLTLTELWPDQPPERPPNKAEREMLARALWHAGYVVAPGPSTVTDVLFVAPRKGAGGFEPSPAAVAALPLVPAAARVVLADGRVEPRARERARARLGELAGVDEGDAVRLGLHLDWLLETGAAKMGKKTFEAVPPDLRRPLLRFLAEVAAADGPVSPAEAKEIVRVAVGLDVPEEEVYPMLHAVHDLSAKTVAKRSAKPTAAGLDMDAIARKLVASRAASEILGAVFVDDDEPPAPPPVPVLNVPDGKAEEPGRGFLQELAYQREWSAREFAALAAKYGKLPAAAHDELNEAALDTVGDPLLDGDDPVSVDLAVAEEMLR